MTNPHSVAPHALRQEKSGPMAKWWETTDLDEADTYTCRVAMKLLKGVYRCR